MKASIQFVIIENNPIFHFGHIYFTLCYMYDLFPKVILKQVWSYSKYFASERMNKRNIHVWASQLSKCKLQYYIEYEWSYFKSEVIFDKRTFTEDEAEQLFTLNESHNMTSKPPVIFLIMFDNFLARISKKSKVTFSNSDSWSVLSESVSRQSFSFAREFFSSNHKRFYQHSFLSLRLFRYIPDSILMRVPKSPLQKSEMGKYFKFIVKLVRVPPSKFHSLWNSGLFPRIGTTGPFSKFGTIVYDIP